MSYAGKCPRCDAPYEANVITCVCGHVLDPGALDAPRPPDPVIAIIDEKQAERGQHELDGLRKDLADMRAGPKQAPSDQLPEVKE